MQGYRIFAFATLILVAAVLVLITTHSMLMYLQADDPRTWLVLLMLGGIYGSVCYALARRFARKPMRPPLTPLITAPLMLTPPVAFSIVVESDVLSGPFLVYYFLVLAAGSAVGTWYGMQAGWKHLIPGLQNPPSVPQPLHDSHKNLPRN